MPDLIATCFLIFPYAASAGIGLGLAFTGTCALWYKLAQGAPIYLTVLGTVHPPVMLHVGEVPA